MAAPQDLPPSYDQVRNQPSQRIVSGVPTTPGGPFTASSSAGRGVGGGEGAGGPVAPELVAAERRSMEDMLRPLPQGWIRQWDPESHHNFFVDTAAAPPRSIWVHPFDDEQFQREHPGEVKRERERLERESLVQADTDEEDDAGPSASKSKGSSSHKAAAAGGVGAGGYGPAAGSSGGGLAGPSTSSSTAAAASEPRGMKKFGRSLKDKMTGTTHEQRLAQRRAREEAERKAMEQHQAIRNALIRAAQTGQPQFLGRDQRGREIYAQPPPPGAYRMGPSLGYGPYQTMNGPYGGYGPYSRPMGPYSRGGGMGMGMPILGGLAGGMLLGGLLF